MKKRSASTATTETAIAEAFDLAHERLAEVLRGCLDGNVRAAPLRSLLGSVTRHIHLEEELLFTPFEEGSGLKEQGPTVLLRREHREILRRLDALAATLESDAGGDARSDVRALLALLDDHRRRESAALFPTCDRLLDGDARATALRELGEPIVTPTPNSTPTRRPGRQVAGKERGKP